MAEALEGTKLWKEQIGAMRFGAKRSGDKQASVPCHFADDTV